MQGHGAVPPGARLLNLESLPAAVFPIKLSVRDCVRTELERLQKAEEATEAAEQERLQKQLEQHEQDKEERERRLAQALEALQVNSQLTEEGHGSETHLSVIWVSGY